MSKGIRFALVLPLLLSLVATRIEARNCKPIHPARAYASSTEYSLDLGDISGAQEVRIEESRSSLFSTSKTYGHSPGFTDPPKFRHVSMRDVQIFYRVTLFNENNPAFIPCTWTEVVLLRGDPAIGRLVRRSYIPVVGSGPGANGAVFKTSMTMINANTEATHGKIVFRAQDVAGGNGDPEIPFTLQPGERREFDDIVAAFGRQRLGSLDIVLDDDAPDWLPLVQTRAFNLASDGATFGVAVPQVPAVKLGEGGRATYVVPNPAKARLNIGVRTWELGGEATFYLIRADGSQVFTVKDLPGDYFQQLPAKEWLGTEIAEGDTIVVFSLGAIVYATLTDNRSNDPTLLIRFGELEAWQTYVGEFFQ